MFQNNLLVLAPIVQMGEVAFGKLSDTEGTWHVGLCHRNEV